MSAQLKIEAKGDSSCLFPVTLKDGSQKHVEVNLQTYVAAGEAAMTLSQYLQLTNPDADTSQGSVFEQMLAAAGIVTYANNEMGLSSISMKSLLTTGVHPGLSAIVRPDGSAANTVAGRLLVAEILLQTTQENLTVSYDDFFSGMEQMIALTDNLAGPVAQQPTINVTAPEASRAQRISQLAEPAVMVSITTGEKTLRIPTKSIGLTISDEAMASSSLDLVQLTLAAQSRGERIANLEGYLNAMIVGDTDLNEAAIASSLVTVYDSTINTAGVMTQKAWVKFLRKDYRKRNIDFVMMDIDTALAIEGRTGRPTADKDNNNSPRINSNERIMNLMIKNPNVFILDTAVIGANTVVGIDSRWAIRRARNLNASYSAVEQYVMRKATSLRLDYAEILTKLFPEAWQKMTLTTS